MMTHAESNPALFTAATEYRAAGLCALPATRAEKRPSVGSWKPYQTRLPTDAELSAWFANGQDALCLLCGQTSGNLETIDFDAQGELFSAWWERAAPDVRDRLVVETTQSGGRHVIYRCAATVCGNLKLAQRKDGDTIVTLIETRGEGGLFLCAPTAGYEVVQGDLRDPPVLTEAERDVLLQAAWELNEYMPPVVDAPRLEPTTGDARAGRPGDDFNERGDLRDLLAHHGWTCVKGGDNEYWRRPGKASGWSATLKDRVFYVFSANAAPFEPQRAYAPFSVYALLEHGGDYEQAARSLREVGFGGDGDDSDVDLSRIIGATPMPSGPPSQPEYPDPGPVPIELLRVPGFVSAVMDHCLATAPYPNVALAFCGALAIQAVLAGRKVRDQGDNRTNIYLLALAYSSVGKDWPRKLNTHVMHRVGLVNSLGEKFASGEGIQDALFLNPALLFQTDEIDGLLQSINKARDARHENILGTLLTMYSASNSIYPMRRKAGKESPGVIDQPCLVVYGTAIPTHYYEALSERMLTNGFFARMIIVESGPRSVGQEPGIIDPPACVVETARWWADFNPGTGNLERFHPQPRVVEADDDARDLLTASRQAAEAEYSSAEARGDPVGTTVWGRVPEQARKLALLYAVSANHESPRIDVGAVRWATDFILHQTRRMLFMAHSHVAENPFHAECLKLLRKLREAPDRQLPHSVLLKRMKVDAKTFHELISTLEQQGDVVICTQSTAGRPQRWYRLVSDAEGEVPAG